MTAEQPPATHYHWRITGQRRGSQIKAIALRHSGNHNLRL